MIQGKINLHAVFIGWKNNANGEQVNLEKNVKAVFLNITCHDEFLYQQDSFQIPELFTLSLKVDVMQHLMQVYCEPFNHC